VDALLQSVRPRLDRAADPARGRVARLRRVLRRASTPADRGWYLEQRDFEVLLRDAIAHLAIEGQSERLARESAERDITAVRVRVDARDETTARLTAATEAVSDRLRHLENRLRAVSLERARAEAGGGAAEAATSAVPPLEDFDYLAFEDRFRGPEGDVRERQAVHADRLAATEGPVADLGCGRGEMLELLRDRGVEAIGVDASAEMVALSRDKGLDADHADVFTWLVARPEGSLGGILCSHVVEHLWPADHMRLARLCAAALRPDGVLILETPNPKSLIAGSINFSCDPTHLRLVFPETLAFMLERAGFVDVRIEYLAPVPDAHRATPVTDVPDGLEGTVAQLNASIAKLDALVFGERDYAVIARAGTLGTGAEGAVSG
jgi:O-antigen chain-terminating methyltransferase